MASNLASFQRQVNNILGSNKIMDQLWLNGVHCVILTHGAKMRMSPTWWEAMDRRVAVPVSGHYEQWEMKLE